MALTGVVGAGKNTTLRRLHETLTKKNRVILVSIHRRREGARIDRRANAT
jgi:type II secretory pathway predicted ATPase ExeA